MQGKGEEGVVWTTQEPKDFSAPSYWRNLAAHDRRKIVQLFQCTLGVGWITKVLETKRIIPNCHILSKRDLLSTFVLFSRPSPQTVISGGGWNQWWRVESGILKTHSVFLPLPAHFVKNISDKKYYSVEGNVILWEWIWMEIINVFIIKELKHAVLKHLSLCSFDQNSLIENTSQAEGS